MDGFLMQNPVKMDDLGVPLFLETPRCCFMKAKGRHNKLAKRLCVCVCLGCFRLTKSISLNKTHQQKNMRLVGGFNPFEKY